jgi:FAD/FMN-containing dehydrogenase
MYGLGVDNVLEMEVVTPTGRLIVANPYHNADLFWAMKGVSLHPDSTSIYAY